MIVMQYANDGNLLSYLDQNINKLTWRMKLQCLYDIAYDLGSIHSAGFVHCDLHGGNIVLDSYDEDQVSWPYICNFGLSRSVNSCESNSTIQGVLSFTAPEVFHTRKFTQKSDIYAFGIIMHLMATGEPPFGEYSFDKCLAMRICEGLRPLMPDFAPEAYKKLAKRCCDADPDKRPNVWGLKGDIDRLIRKVDKDNSDNNTWNTIYHNDVKTLVTSREGE